MWGRGGAGRVALGGRDCGGFGAVLLGVLVFGWGCGVGVEVVGGKGAKGVEVREGMSCDSSLKRARCARSSFWNSLTPYNPSRIGAVKRGQSVSARCRKDMMSRPECLAKVSHTADRKRVYRSDVSLAVG